jgi:hypothetical protein
VSIVLTMCGDDHVSPPSVDLMNAIANPCGAVDCGPLFGPVPAMRVKKS